MSVGVRLKPWGATRQAAEQLGGWFVDGNVGYVQTGGLDRFGFDAGLGYVFQLSDRVGLGPVVRYNQIVQGDATLNQDPRTRSSSPPVHCAGCCSSPARTTALWRDRRGRGGAAGELALLGQGPRRAV